MVDIFSAQPKVTINKTLFGKSIAVVGKSKAGKSTLAAQAPRPIFLMTENGGEALTGFTPIPIASWSDFKSAVSQLCTERAKETFDTVVIDTYTNLLIMLDKYIGSKISTDKQSYDFGSDADYGKGTRFIKNELNFQLQRLANQGYLMLNIIHAEDKTDFNTQKQYIGTSLSNSLYGVAEKFCDQIIYLRKDIDRKGNVEHRIWFNAKGGFSGAGGRFTPAVDSVPCSYKELEGALLGAMDTICADAKVEVTNVKAPSVVITEDKYDFDELKNEFNELVKKAIEGEDVDDKAVKLKIKGICERILGNGKKVADLTASQAELLNEVNQAIKAEIL